MSFPTVPAYVETKKGWAERPNEHPVFTWMRGYEAAFDWGDMKKGPHSPWHTDDFSFTKPSGTTTSGGDPAWKALLETYGPFQAHYHEPQWFIIWETSEGYELIGVAELYANLPVPGEKTKTDLEGRKWDVQGPGAFHFKYVKDPSGPQGLKLKSEYLYSSGGPAVAEMIKRGMVTSDEAIALGSS